MSHRSIPCPKCDRIWLWSEDKDSKKAFCPDGYGCADDENQQNDIAEKLEDISDRLDNLERDVRWLVQYVMQLNRPLQPPPYIPNPVPTQLDSTTCSTCGMLWSGAIGYVCLNQNCPIQMKVTC